MTSSCLPVAMARYFLVVSVTLVTLLTLLLRMVRMSSQWHSPACWYLPLSPAAYRARVQIADGRLVVNPLLGGDFLLSISPTPVKSTAWLLVAARMVYFLVVMSSSISLPPQSSRGSSMEMIMS